MSLKNFKAYFLPERLSGMKTMSRKKNLEEINFLLFTVDPLMTLKTQLDNFTLKTKQHYIFPVELLVGSLCSFRKKGTFESCNY